MKKLGFVIASFGFVLMLLSFVRIQFTGAAIGAGGDFFSMILISGISCFALGVFLLNSGSLEGIAGYESPSKTVKIMSKVANVGRSAYAIAMVPVRTVFNTIGDAAREARQGIKETGKAYLENIAYADSYRNMAGINEGIGSRLNPRKNAKYVEKYQELHHLRNALRKMTKRKITLGQAYQTYADVTSEHENLTRMVRAMEEAQARGDLGLADRIRNTIGHTIDPQKISLYNACQKLLEEVKEAEVEASEKRAKHYAEVAEQTANIKHIYHSNPKAAANYVGLGKQFDREVRKRKKHKR